MLELPGKVLTKARRFSRRSLFGVHGRLHETVTVQTKQGLLTMSTRDHGIAASLFRDRQYEFEWSVRCIRFLKDEGFIPRKDVTMLDVGANIGLISTGLLLANEIQSAIAMEPEPNNFELLEQNVRQNGLKDRMRCLQMAVGNEPSTLTMELSSANQGDHRIRSRPAPGATEQYGESSRESIEIPSLPLAQILELPELKAPEVGAPSLLWIDVQGYEGYVFEGGQEFLRTVPAVSEVWPYGLLRAGIPLSRFVDTVSSIWTDYWVYRRGEFTRYPISVFDRFLDEVGNERHHENVIFTHELAKP